jgi:hypothetical protein
MPAGPPYYRQSNKTKARTDGGGAQGAQYRDEEAMGREEGGSLEPAHQEGSGRDVVQEPFLTLEVVEFARGAATGASAGGHPRGELVEPQQTVETEMVVSQ